MFDHHLVEPRFHPGTGLTALPVAAIVTFDAPGDSTKTDLFTFPVIALDLGIGRRREPYLAAFDSIKDGVSHSLWKLLPWRVQRKALASRQAVHHASVPGIRVVFERFLNEATAHDTSRRI